MKKIVLSVMLAVLGIQTHAQEIYALTGKAGTAIHFNDLRSLDVKKSNAGEVLLSADAESSVFSQNLQQNLKESKNSVHHAQTPAMAALAFDKNSGSLFFIPMFSSNVYVMDTKTRQITLVENTAIKSAACTLASHITRMTSTKDGTVYAMSNSGSQLLKISNKNGRYAVQDLGSVKDNAPGAEVSIAKMLTGFGGDMVADAQNNLYVFSASKYIYKVNIADLSAELIGKISGLPENYTLNGAAVNNAGNIIIGNAQGQPMYEVNFKTLQAQEISGDLKIPVYDLASSFFINDTASVSEQEMLTGISVYPTKVNQQYFNIKIDNKNIKGSLKVEVSDLMGNKVVKQNIAVLRDHSEFRIDLKKANTGVYIITVMDAGAKTIFSDKILVE